MGPHIAKQLEKIGTSAISAGYRSSAVKHRIARVPDDLARGPVKVVPGAHRRAKESLLWPLIRLKRPTHLRAYLSSVFQILS